MKRIEMDVSGGCQCGAVRYHATAMLDNSHLCHCRMCQKASGNIFAALVAAPDDALSWTRGKRASGRARSLSSAASAPIAAPHCSSTTSKTVAPT